MLGRILAVASQQLPPDQRYGFLTYFELLKKRNDKAPVAQRQTMEELLLWRFPHIYRNAGEISGTDLMLLGKVTMTKAEIVHRVCEKNTVSSIDASNIVEAAFEIIKGFLRAWRKSKNFGNFAVRTKNPRRGRNPYSGEEIVIAGRKVFFKPSPAMKKARGWYVLGLNI
jgi:nucleoid DNA-binding protein